MIRRPPRSTQAKTLFPYTTLFRSSSITLYFSLELSPAKNIPTVCPSTRLLSAKDKSLLDTYASFKTATTSCDKSFGGHGRVESWSHITDGEEDQAALSRVGTCAYTFDGTWGDGRSRAAMSRGRGYFSVEHDLENGCSAAAATLPRRAAPTPAHPTCRTQVPGGASRDRRHWRLTGSTEHAQQRRCGVAGRPALESSLWEPVVVPATS